MVPNSGRRRSRGIPDIWFAPAGEGRNAERMSAFAQWR